MTKARYVSEGYNDADKTKLVHNTKTIRPPSIQTILCIASIHVLESFSHDFTQANLQCRAKLKRRIFIRVKKDDLTTYGIRSDQFLELLKPLHGLCNAGNYWGVTIAEHVVNDHGMKPPTSYPALYVKFSDSGLIVGLFGVHIDDCLNAGDESFKSSSLKTLKKFEFEPPIYNYFDFFRTQVITISSGKFHFGQLYFTKNLSNLSKDATFEDFCRHRALVSWLVNTKPYIAFQANRAAQVSKRLFCREKLML